VEVVAAERHRETVVMVAVLCWSLLLWRVAERPLGLSSGTSAGLEETGGWHTPCQVPGSGAGDLSASTALPTRYLLYLTRLSRPPESRDWGEARGQSRARAGKSLDRML
jgi:hypothetical protein